MVINWAHKGGYFLLFLFRKKNNFFFGLGTLRFGCGSFAEFSINSFWILEKQGQGNLNLYKGKGEEGRGYFHPEAVEGSRHQKIPPKKEKKQVFFPWLDGVGK